MSIALRRGQLQKPHPPPPPKKKKKKKREKKRKRKKKKREKKTNSEVDGFLEATIILKRWSCFQVNARGNFFGVE